MVGGNNRGEEYMMMGVMICNKDKFVIQACRSCPALEKR